MDDFIRRFQNIWMLFLWLVYRIQMKAFECPNYRQGQSALWMCACAWCITSQPNHILSGRFQDLESESYLACSHTTLSLLLAHTHSLSCLLTQTHTHSLFLLLALCSLTQSLSLSCLLTLSLSCLLSHTHALSLLLALCLLTHSLSLLLALSLTHTLSCLPTHTFSISLYTHSLSPCLLSHTLLLAHTHATCDNATSRSCARARDVKKLNHTPTILTLPRLITHAQAGFCEGFHSPAYSVDFRRFTVDEFQQFVEDYNWGSF
jgi:hypothetical protein